MNNFTNIQWRASSSSTLDKFQGGLGTGDTFQAEPIVLVIKDPARHIRGFHAIVEEGVRQEFRKILRVIGWAIEDEVPDSPNFVARM